MIIGQRQSIPLQTLLRQKGDVGTSLERLRRKAERQINDHVSKHGMSKIGNARVVVSVEVEWDVTPGHMDAVRVDLGADR